MVLARIIRQHSGWNPVVPRETKERRRQTRFAGISQTHLEIYRIFLDGINFYSASSLCYFVLTVFGRTGV